jgi:hypothetical protein
MSRILGSILIACFLWFGYVLVGVDRFRTISTDTVLSRVIVGLIVATLFALTLWRYVVETPASEKSARLKRQRRPLWVVLGIASAALLSGGGGFIADRLIRSFAEHIPGTQREFTGTVASIRHVNSGRTACLAYASVAVSETANTQTVCVVSAVGTPLGPRDLRVKDNVRVRVNDTVFGPVALLIERDE